MGKDGYISIITPVYNVEAYLEKCLESILRQTWQDFELILVDDGSTDASGDICDRFAASDKRITVIHKKNEGVTSARKAGILAATGEFVGWVDADDWIEKDYFESFVAAQRESGADIVAGNHFRDIGEQSYTVHNDIPDGQYDSKSILPNLIYSGKFFELGLHASLWSKLIRKELLDKILGYVDNKMHYAEDALMVWLSILEADKILVTDICGYHYVQHQGSITKSEGVDDLKKIRFVFHALESAFIKKGIWEKLRFQLGQWEKFVLLERHIQVFDGKNSESILLPYGGIPLHSRIVIYGGSALGQTIDRYIRESDRAENVLWIDMAYENFQRQGLPIVSPEDIKKLDGEYDYVLLASVTERIVDSMKKYLLGLQVPENKIRWLTEEFIRDDILNHAEGDV